MARDKVFCVSPHDATQTGETRKIVLAGGLALHVSELNIFLDPSNFARLDVRKYRKTQTADLKEKGSNDRVV